MKLLIDTHYLLWLFMDTAKISDKVKEVLISTDNEIYYSQVSLWEIAVKYSIGKLFLNGVTPERFYQEIQQSFLLYKKLENQTLISSHCLSREHNGNGRRVSTHLKVCGFTAEIISNQINNLRRVSKESTLLFSSL